MEENVLNYDAQSVDNSAKEKKKNKTKKVIATTTYFIAMLCLLAGLFVPLFNCVDGVAVQERMMFRYLPSMLNGMCGKEILPPDKLGNWFLPYQFSGRFDLGALVGLLYAVVCVISVVMLIPILLGSKKKNSSARCALGVEVLAMLVTLTYIAYTTYTMTTLTWTDYNFLLAFGGALLMAIIQTVSSKGSIGVSKIIALLLSVVGVMALLNITMFIPKLADPLASLSQKIKGGNSATFLDWAIGEEGVEASTGADGILGIFGINMLVDIKNTRATFKMLAQMGKGGIVMIVVFVLLILVALLTVINLVSDVIGLSTGKKYNKDRSPCKNGASNTFALVRYILPILFAAAIIIISFAVKDLGLHAGVYLYLLVIVLLISLINAAVRTAVDNARYKKGTVAPATEAQQIPVFNDPAFAAKTAKQPEPERERLPVAEEPVVAEETFDEPAYERLPVVEETPEYEEPQYMPTLPVVEAETEPEPVAEPLSAPLDEPEETETTRTVYIYGGATDEFMDTLTDQEKVEFVELFIKKSKGSVNGVPDYTIDGDNGDFFPAVFVHINRYRNLVSDALMSKMYKQLGKAM